MDKQKKVQTSVKDERLIEKRRNQMVKAAVQLFTEKGFHRTTTREIAKASGFSIGTLYEYIRSKEDVLYLVCDDIYSQVSERLKESIDDQGDPLEGLKSAITQYIKVIDEMQDEVLVMYQEAKSLSNEALPYVLNKELEMALIFEEILKRCVALGVLELSEEDMYFYSQHIIVQCQMWTFRRWALHKKMTIEQFISSQINVLVDGLLHSHKNQSAMSR